MCYMSIIIPFQIYGLMPYAAFTANANRASGVNDFNEVNVKTRLGTSGGLAARLLSANDANRRADDVN